MTFFENNLNQSFQQYALSLCIALLLAGCTVVKHATLLDIETAEKLTAKFTDSDRTGGQCEVIMANGEKLVGTYTGIRGIDVVSFSNATGSIASNATLNSSNGTTITGSSSTNYSAAGSTRLVGGQGKAYALLSSTKSGSKLVMEIIAIYSVVGGGGFGDARTNDGRIYRVIF
jgi:hypothetical protein